MMFAEREGFTSLRKTMSEPVQARAQRQVPVYSGRDATSALLVKTSRFELHKERWMEVPQVASSFTKNETIAEEVSLSGSEDEATKAVVVVDPFSTGALLARKAAELGYEVVRVLSDGDSPIASFVSEGLSVDFVATVTISDTSKRAYDDAADELRKLPFRLTALMAGAETGVLAADELSTRLNLRGNGVALSKARRNKFLMGERVRSTGTRAVAQKIVKNLEEAKEFLDAYKKFPVVVKPLESAGSDDVFKCQNREDVKVALSKIVGTVNGLGARNDAALIQEFLKGDEYVVDSVSKNGIHKVTAIWVYDKRRINDADFVYFGMRLLDSSGLTSEEEREIASRLVTYSQKVLEALHFKNGPSHMEIKYDLQSGPCLVEVGARCHGGEGSWVALAEACVGYTQVDVTFDAYGLTKKDFMKDVPSVPPPLKKFGVELFFVGQVSGMVRSTAPATNFIKSLPSFHRIEWQLKAGDFAPLTVDCFTRPGSAQLIHASKEQVLKDCDLVRSLEDKKKKSTQTLKIKTPPLLDLEFVCRLPIDTGTVVVVDPYSSGAILAERVRSRHRKKLIVVHSDPKSPIAGLVASGTSIRAQANVCHEGNLEVTIKKILEQCHKGVIVACLPGAETGVILADEIAEKLGTRLNPPRLSQARRNKYFMGEAVRAAGVRAVEQCRATTWEDAELFLKTCEATFPLVVKPIESAGSDDVFKCFSKEDVKKAVLLINGKVNSLGQRNEGCLLQEFLRGDEFVVDAVSRDGDHKITAIWRYDKRSVNEAHFVYHAMEMIDFQKEPVLTNTLADYSNLVRDALDITDGPSHMEIKVNEQMEPCLVEVGARCHGGEGTWLPIADACVGYNQIDATLDAYLDPDAFDSLPALPPAFKQFGREVFLVSHQQGLLESVNVDLIRKLKSFTKMELAVQPGSILKPTTDCFTRPGSVQLVHSDPQVVDDDYHTIRSLEQANNLFLLTTTSSLAHTK